ncbi:hypothetical protein SAMN06265784_11181 [Paraburkholderia susongensis]|uniref:Uncharacterized protein n=1 Tax=Paraburkholderia susongensis TaxID=1515439 RepID=A0A1X7LX86_9BURK|nr:hypothetical protein SAMN06265784_11181 [Paraburkholderia susongensis]
MGIVALTGIDPGRHCFFFMPSRVDRADWADHVGRLSARLSIARRHRSCAGACTRAFH